MVSPQLPEKSRELREKQDLDFPILFDEANRFAETLQIAHGFTPELQAIYGQFGIDVGGTNGSSEWRLPMPAQFIVDAAGTVTSAEVNPDYTVRPEPSGIVARLPD